MRARRGLWTSRQDLETSISAMVTRRQGEAEPMQELGEVGGRTSAFARISQPVAFESDRIRMSFVLPINPSTPSTISSSGVEVSALVRTLVCFRGDEMRMYVADVPRAMPRDRKRRERGREENDIK